MPRSRAFTALQSGRRGGQKHRVTVAEKTIAFRDRMGIGRKQGVRADESRAQHQQRRFGKMKIRQHGIDRAKLGSRA